MFVHNSDIKIGPLVIYAWIHDQKHTTESIYLKQMFMFHSFLYSAVNVWSIIFKWYKNLYY